MSNLFYSTRIFMITLYSLSFCHIYENTEVFGDSNLFKNPELNSESTIRKITQNSRRILEKRTKEKRDFIKSTQKLSSSKNSRLGINPLFKSDDLSINFDTKNQKHSSIESHDFSFLKDHSFDFKNSKNQKLNSIFSNSYENEKSFSPFARILKELINEVKDAAEEKYREGSDLNVEDYHSQSLDPVFVISIDKDEKKVLESDKAKEITTLFQERASKIGDDFGNSKSYFNMF